MKVLPVKNSIKQVAYNVYGHISKKMLASQNKTKPILKSTENEIKVLAKHNIPIYNIEEFLKQKGITACSTNNNIINIITGNNQGYYRIKTTHSLNDIQAKEFLKISLSSDRSGLGGLLNYMAIIKDLSRQDIINKGLKIHSYELNTSISQKQAEMSAKKLSRILKRDIKQNKLFFIEKDAFFYDEITKTGYSTTIPVMKSDLKKTDILQCRFITDNKKNTIGYDYTAWDLYKLKMVDSNYTEQQVPSVKLKPIAEADNNKEFAEAFRFGNSKKSDTARKGIKTVLEHLKDKAKICKPIEEELQFVRFFDKNKDIKSRICYFDSASGTSFVYTPEGKYMYRLDYIKDFQGNITALNRI